MSLIARSTPGNPDPLAVFTQPPPDETVQQKAQREKQEAEARRVSDEIDEGLKRDKAALKKERELIVKVLLLGQSESGKSTTLKSWFLPRVFRHCDARTDRLSLNFLVCRFSSSLCSRFVEGGAYFLASCYPA
jgi:hypothetical protein